MKFDEKRGLGLIHQAPANPKYSSASLTTADANVGGKQISGPLLATNAGSWKHR